VKRPTNSAVASGIATAEPGADSWLSFDNLPREVREILWGAPVSINPLTIAPLVSDGGVDYAASTTIGAIRDEIGKFDRQHNEQHGYRLPSVASGVQPLRYGAGLKESKAGARPHRREVIRPRRRKT
jgi:hypothetical protein